ncbi:MAG: SIMPL domain-containing protein [Candidatus Pacearchaeota archaeon]
MDNKIAFVILAVAILIVGAYLYVNTSSNENTISVSGNSEITAKPEFTSIYVNIETSDKSAQQSQEKNSEISNKIIDLLEDSGFKKGDIETINFNVYEDYDWTQGGRIFKGYKTIHTLKIKVEDIKLAGIVIDKAVESGGIINSIQFEISKEKENSLKAEALEKATLDAKNKAEAIAKGSGGKLGKLISINTNEYNYIPFVAYEKSASLGSGSGVNNIDEAKRAAVQISEKTLTITANVQAVYKIK